MKITIGDHEFQSPFHIAGSRAALAQLARLCQNAADRMPEGAAVTSFLVEGFDEDIAAKREAEQLAFEDRTIARAEEIKSARARGEPLEQRRPSWWD
jgi:hypothetical protein